MSARQPFFPARPGSESQGTAQGFNQKTFLIDPSNPLHLASDSQAIPTTNQSESTKIAFRVPGPFSNNGANSTPQAKTSGFNGFSKKNSAHNASQSVEKDRKGSLNSLGFLDLTSSNVRPGTADPRSELHQDHITALEAQHSFGYQKPSSRSLGLLDASSIVRPGTSEVDHEHLNASVTSHEVIADGRLKTSAFGQTKKRNRDEIEEDGDGSYWVESQAKRHKSRHREGFESRGYAKSPSFSPRLERASSRASHPEGDIRQHFPDARGSPRSPRYSKRRTTSPVKEGHLPPYETQAEQATLDDRRNAFEKLLGRDTDAFVKQNMEKYDHLVKKWSECTEEEWIAGAEVITEKYVKIVSYVKDAMIAKINAYANIQADIGRHISDLGERDQLLDAARKKLIKESGNALG